MLPDTRMWRPTLSALFSLALIVSTHDLGAQARTTDTSFTAWMTAQGFRSWTTARALPGNSAPRYPDQLRREGIEGTVLVAFVVDTVGVPDMFEVLTSSHELFRTSVLTALTSARFTPAQINGNKVKQLVQMPFTFTFALAGRAGGGGAEPDTAHRTMPCANGRCPVFRLARVVSTANP